MQFLENICLGVIVIPGVLFILWMFFRSAAGSVSPPDKSPVKLKGKGAIMEAAAILEQRRYGRERGGLVVIRGRRALEPLMYGDYATKVNYRHMKKHHAKEFVVED